MHESEGNTLTLGTPGMALYDARDGQIIWSFVPGQDVGRGMTADIDPRTPGDEFWGAHGGRPARRARAIGSPMRRPR